MTKSDIAARIRFTQCDHMTNQLTKLQETAQRLRRKLDTLTSQPVSEDIHVTSIPLTAKDPCFCDYCGHDIPKGEPIYMETTSRADLCQECFDTINQELETINEAN